MGDPSGIGPEVILKALIDPAVTSECEPVILGDERVLEAVRAELELPLELSRVDTVPESPSPRAVIPVKNLSDLDPEAIRAGKSPADLPGAVIRYLEEGIALAREGAVGSLVTGPLPKSVFQAAGGAHSGHTEFLAERTGVREVAMMFVGGALRVALATIHLPLAEVTRTLTRDGIRGKLRLIHGELRRLFRVERPRIAVAGLNPHAGEDGLLGKEEIEVILPAVEDAAREGILASGPYPADALFPRARSGEFDCILAMYHDQGLAPFKMLYFSEGVNVTLGLPFVRTSPDHGTARDISGKGIADPSSMRNAILLAAELAGNSRFSG